MNYQVVIVAVGMLKSFPLHSSGFSGVATCKYFLSAILINLVLTVERN